MGDNKQNLSFETQIIKDLQNKVKKLEFDIKEKESLISSFEKKEIKNDKLIKPDYDETFGEAFIFVSKILINGMVTRLKSLISSLQSSSSDQALQQEDLKKKKE